ncbi:MAG TPA: hypothetical protein VJ579_00815 [Candidatus Paceibacterota bacterium]|nr:hypothetical protein [Candidatus Paceibacterota bacterium]
MNIALSEAIISQLEPKVIKAQISDADCLTGDMRTQARCTGRTLSESHVEVR